MPWIWKCPICEQDQCSLSCFTCYEQGIDVDAALIKLESADDAETKRYIASQLVMQGHKTRDWYKSVAGLGDIT